MFSVLFRVIAVLSGRSGQHYKSSSIIYSLIPESKPLILSITYFISNLYIEKYLVVEDQMRNKPHG